MTKNFERFKLKAFADHNSNKAIFMPVGCERLENMEVKGKLLVTINFFYTHRVSCPIKDKIYNLTLYHTIQLLHDPEEAF